jgi:hypothetical protein
LAANKAALQHLRQQPCEASFAVHPAEQQHPLPVAGQKKIVKKGE